MSFVVSYGKDTKIIEVRKRKTPSPAYILKKENAIIIGDFFDATEDEILFGGGWKENPSILDKYNAAISIVSFDEENCFFYSNLYSQESLYYFCDDLKENIYISDDFWDIVKILEPTFEMLNIDNIKLMLELGGALLNDQTIIKGLKLLLPGMLVKFNKQSYSLTIEKHDFLEFERLVDSLNEAVDRIDYSMDKTIKDIKKKHGDVVYGIGLSGGLDSRLVLHYALKNNMKVMCFNLCDVRPHLFLKARSVRLAEKIANVCRIPIKLVQWDRNEIDIAKKKKTQYYPNGPLSEAALDIYKFNSEELAEMDVLLNGGANIAGYLVCGTMDQANVTGLSEITQYIENKIIYVYSTYNSTKFLKGVSAIFNIPVKTKTKYKYKWEKSLYEEQKQIIHNRIEDFVRDMLKRGFQNGYEIVINFRMLFLANQLRNGAFESKFGEKRSYSIYSPIVLREALKFNYMNEELLKDRNVLRELIRQKAPELSIIDEENYMPSPQRINNKLDRILSITDRAIRGDGAHIAPKYWKDKKVYESFLSDMNNKCTWFYRIFNIKDHVNDIRHTNYRLMNSLWNIKRIIDCIEMKEYINF